MVFANLTEEDKQAFFALLDEYFASRPELADALQSTWDRDRDRDNHRAPRVNRDIASTATAGGLAAVHRALATANSSQPQPAAGLRTVPKSTPYASAASNPEISNAVGRIAAAFNNSASGTNPSPSGAPGRSQQSNLSKPPGPHSELRPPPPPRRSTSNSSLNSSAPAAAATTSEKHQHQQPPPPPRAPLSGKTLPWSMRNNNNNTNKEVPASTAPAPTVVPSVSKSRPLAPPPRRSTRPRTPTPEPEPEPEEEVEPEQEYEGEWAEALYDYKSTDPNDLSLQAEQRVLVTARTSDDWWTGEADGRSGLFPASYVKLL